MALQKLDRAKHVMLPSQTPFAGHAMHSVLNFCAHVVSQPPTRSSLEYVS